VAAAAKPSKAAAATAALQAPLRRRLSGDEDGGVQAAIVGGVAARKGRYPYMVSLRRNARGEREYLLPAFAMCTFMAPVSSLSCLDARATLTALPRRRCLLLLPLTALFCGGTLIAPRIVLTAAVS
jgi:secreted trypsin-like serine protease